MTTIFAKRALLTDGWADDVRLTLEGDVVGAIETGVPAAPSRSPDDAPNGSPDVAIVHTLLPALSNLHSHSFQRAMAGMTEHRRAGRDSFWTWRDLMYRFTAHLTPEMIEAVAGFAFMEMQEAGFAAVGEFHYLHHQPDGAPYDDVAELSLRIAAAADRTGIGLTHLPVLYTYGGAGETPLSPGQARFGNTPERFARLVERARDGLKSLPRDSRIGVAPHSLRATAPADLAETIAAHPEGPVHIHIAEQPKEVEDVEAWLGARPVEWLLGEHDVGGRWCLIHATHMTHAETRALARSGAVAGLCPITEANLGDGPFNGRDFLEAGGAFGVGTDSNVLISAPEELRTLEYSQRLRDVARNVLVVGEGSVGQTLYTMAATGGAQALGRDAGRIAPGALADLVAIDGENPSLCALTAEQTLDGWIFAARAPVVTDLWSAGRRMVENGVHLRRDDIVADYRTAMKRLVTLL